MTEFISLAKSRKSLRKYAPTPVPREHLHLCLEAAQLAPSACNSQPWKYIVMDRPEVCRPLAREAFGGIYSMNAFACEAPVLVAVVRKRSKFPAHLGGAFRRTQFNLIDIGISTAHFVLQAEELGIGTCYIGWFDSRMVIKRLGLPRGSKIDLMISMGYPPDSTAPKKEKSRKDPTETGRFFPA